MYSAVSGRGSVAKQSCAYCGGEAGNERDHVVPSNLYPSSKSSSKVQRITVPACRACNGGWADDEAHFRTMVVIAGPPNAVVNELWEGPTRRSHEEPDGPRRKRDVASQLVPVDTPEGPRYKVYPGRDPRVLRVVRKIVRGLCHHHRLMSPVYESKVWADIKKYEIPTAFRVGFTHAHVEEDVLQYEYTVLDDENLHSAWVLTFFERTPFMGIVARTDAYLSQAEGGGVAVED